MDAQDKQDMKEMRDKLVRLDAAQDHQTKILIDIHATVKAVENEQREHSKADTAMFTEVRREVAQTKAETVLETIRVKTETEKRIVEVERDISIAKKIVLFVWTPLTALAAAGINLWAKKW